MADLIEQADALIKGRLRADRLPECSFDDGRTWQTDDVLVAETFALAADLIESLTAQVAVMGEALEPFAKAGELFVKYQSEYPACVYRPAAGDEYSLDSGHLLAARKARLAAAKEPS